MDGLRWVSDLLANSFPELKPVAHSYPIQLRPAVGDNELHHACLRQSGTSAYGLNSLRIFSSSSAARSLEVSKDLVARNETHALPLGTVASMFNPLHSSTL